MSHELVMVVLSNGDECLYLNGFTVCYSNAGDVQTNSTKVVAERLSVILDVDVRCISMDVPLDDDWNWDDVYELLPSSETVSGHEVMTVSIDGGLTFVPAPSGVRIAYPNVFVPGEDEPGHLELNHTSEGLIVDVWVSRDEPLDHNIGTYCTGLDEIMAKAIEIGA